MNFSSFLILLGIIRVVFSARSNNTGHDSCNVCTLSFFRRKRANTDYTRWHANAETKQEFIVKVLDDISTTETEQIAAVNIQPITETQENIIIRGAVVPPTATLDLLKEYTRFGPPTTLSVTRVNGNIIFAPVKAIIATIPPVRPHATETKYGHIGRTQPDSPLPDLQFLPRSQTLMNRQYAAIAPVSFTRRDPMGPLTPRTVDKFMLHKTTARPTRTSSFVDILVPLRTSDLVNFLRFKYSTTLSDKVLISRSTLIPIDLQRTSLMEDLSIEKEKLRKNNLDNKNIDTELDTFYNDLLYNNENDNEINTKKEHSLIDNYEDDNKKTFDTDNKSENGFNSTEIGTATGESKRNMEIQQSYVNYEDEGYVDNATVTCKVDENSSEPVTIMVNSKPLKIGNVKKKLNCTVLKLRQLSFSSPLTLHEIETQLKQWAEESHVAKRMDITRGNYTVMDNPIYMMIVDDPSSGQIASAKQTVMIVAGIQGRDHHAVTAAMYVLYQLIERSETHSDLLTKFRFWIVPVFNPDGYDYSMTFPHRRDWSKNLRQSWDSCKGRDSCQACEEFGIRCTIKPCYGVNLDRNFEYQWIPAEELRAERPCGPLYAGPRQLSEAETQALTQLLHEQRSPLYTFIAFKEGDVLGIMYPHAHTRKTRALDHVYRQRASRAASAAYSISGRPYVAGQTSEFLPLYAGGVEDWVDGHLGIDNTYTVMMFRPTDSQKSKLETERVVHEAYAAVDTLLLQSVEKVVPPVTILTRAKASRSISIPAPFAVLIIVVKLGYSYISSTKM